MSLIARWVQEMRPCAMVIDVSVEVALFVRLLGVPVIVMTVPGERTDGPHMLVHQLADHILAAWPKELYEPAWLRIHATKTSYVGGISRFDDRGVRSPAKDRTSVLVLGGMGGCEFDQATVDATAARLPEIIWRTLGLRGGPRTADPWPEICAADIVVTHGGQNCIADVATARRPAVVLPQSRPFDEQHATAEVLHRHGLAVAFNGWPEDSAWLRLLDGARASDPRKWEQWQTAGAATRAAQEIETATSRFSERAPV